MNDQQPLELLLEHLKRTRGFDFSGYKRATLERRIERRMNAVGVTSTLEYLDYLEVHPDEFPLLFDTILINVTRFFRDPAAWRRLSEQHLPAMLESKPAGSPIRAWCAGCSSGEEPYTIAIALAEALGGQAFLERVKIYATDVDEDALEQARHSVYPAKAIEDIPADLRDRYFTGADGSHTFRQDLRRAVIFGRNDLVQDAPISRIDLLVSRNTLMYFNAETQSRILRHFHFALEEHGLLFLGRSEMLITHSDLFRPLELKQRIFKKVPVPRARESLVFLNGIAHPGEIEGDGIKDGAFDESPTPLIVVDSAGTLVLANALARRSFALKPADLGRPMKDLEVFYRPLELRSGIDEALRERRPVALGTASLGIDQESRRELEVQALPIGARDGDPIGVLVAFKDMTAQQRLQAELGRVKRDLETSYEELQSTVEELETTNEELQATNEELETTNEELQSANEELETMNEELHATNEELENTNDELHRRGDDLDELNAFLETILTSMGVAVIATDADQLVQVWNHRAEDIWGLRGEEVNGHHFLALDIGLPVERLKAPLRSILTGDEARIELTVDATNRRGRAIACHVVALPLIVKDGRVNGTILLMEEAPSADSRPE
jgi:two-component system CheB/CheR fusion protein